MLFNILLGLAMIAIGLLMLKFWRNVYSFTGAIDFVERYFTAGTPSFIKIVGIILVIIGMGMVFGFWAWLTAPLTEGVKGLSGQGIQR